MRRLPSSPILKPSNLLRFLVSQNPKPQISFIHLATEKPSNHKLPKSQPSSSSSSPQLLNSNNNDNPNSKILQLLSSDPNSISATQLLEQLPDFSTALDFLRQIRSISPCPDDDSLSLVLQAVLEVANGENNYGEKLLEVYNASKELDIPLDEFSAILLIRGFGKERLVGNLMLVFNDLETQKRVVGIRNVLIEELLRNGSVDDALQVLDEMLQPNSAFPPDETTKDVAFEGLFHLQGPKYQRYISGKEIVDLVSKFGEHNLFPHVARLTKWITKLCKTGEYNAAWDLLKVMMDSNGPIDVSLFNALLTGLEKKGQFKMMNLVMQEMKDRNILPDVVTMGISLKHLCNAQRVDEAFELFEKMRGEGEIGVAIEPDVVILNILIDGLCKVGRLEEGLGLMRRMKSYNCDPIASTYNCLIDGYCKAGELEKALELFHEMGEKGVEPNTITLNCVVDGMCKHGKPGSALEFFKEMVEKGSLECNARTYTALIGGFCAVNNINKAMDLFEEMREKFTPDAVVYYTLISGLSLAGQAEDAHAVFLEMRDAGFQPDIGCYNVIINAFCKCNKMGKAHFMVKDMTRAGVKPDALTYNTLISYFSKHGDLKTAHKLLMQMLNDKITPTVVTYGALIHGLCRAGELDEALGIFGKMRSASSTRIPPSTVIYNTLITCLCERKELKTALELLDDMKQKEVSPNTTTFNAILKALQEENCTEKAFEIMDRMIEEACNPDYITLEILTEWLPGVGKADRLRKFVQGYKVSGKKTSSK